MKKLLLIGSLLALVGSLSAQTVVRTKMQYRDSVTFDAPVVFNSTVTVSDEPRRVNTLYLSFQPTDLGVGIRYDRQITDCGLYYSVSYGNYRFTEGYIDNHVKVAVGGLKYTHSSFYSFGVAYHYYGERSLDYDPIPRVFQTFSPEFGVGVTLAKVRVALTMDVVKWESAVNLGWSF